jgi:hypothetical protein
MSSQHRKAIQFRFKHRGKKSILRLCWHVSDLNFPRAIDLNLPDILDYSTDQSQVASTEILFNLLDF